MTIKKSIITAREYKKLVLSEKDLHKQICEYLRLKNVIFNTDLSGLKMTIGQAASISQLRSEAGFPDIVVYKANSLYHALFLEVKKEQWFNKKGMFKTEHIKMQAEFHEKLRTAGYYVEFTCTLLSAKKIIDWYCYIQ